MKGLQIMNKILTKNKISHFKSKLISFNKKRERIVLFSRCSLGSCGLLSDFSSFIKINILHNCYIFNCACGFHKLFHNEAV
jgi:hypothetical protein